MIILDSEIKSVNIVNISQKQLIYNYALLLVRSIPLPNDNIIPSIYIHNIATNTYDVYFNTLHCSLPYTITTISALIIKYSFVQLN